MEAESVKYLSDSVNDTRNQKLAGTVFILAHQFTMPLIKEYGIYREHSASDEFYKLYGVQGSDRMYVVLAPPLVGKG